MAVPGDWKSLWKIHTPPKAKYLLWRICRECLPTRARLQERHVNCPEVCPVCELEIEHDWHFLFACNDNMHAWTAAGLDAVVLPRLQQFSTVKGVIMDVCSKEDRDVAGRMALLVWSLWNNRNNCVWNIIKEAGQQIGIKSECMWREWQAVADSAQCRFRARYNNAAIV
ncbi:pentatricopeptide repeat-containing protein [Trifolium medium]|uniref:Pentatricopeptide repeat-containing protein n=1 Tax=Trifolium medium TaxID=97028 RepID=A0A392N0Q9_9FABA|nr:pentatricopeptide repeat-containing protein [Trifolium medium]